jgi:hypothetical protein
MNDHWNVLYEVSVFYMNRKSKMADTAGHKLTLYPTVNVEMPSSQKLKNHPRNIHAKFGSNWPSGCGEEA